MKTSTVIVAAGKSSRFGTDKLKSILAGFPVLIRTIAAFQSHSEIDEIIIVVHPDRLEEFTPLKKSFSKVLKIVAGGTERASSSINGLQAASGEILLVHNGANPLVTHKEISDCILAIKQHGAAGVGRKVSSTLKQVQGTQIEKTIPRENLYEMETPQGFTREVFEKALSLRGGTTKQSPMQPESNETASSSEALLAETALFTDELQLLESAGIFGQIIEASPQNRKITSPYDLQVAECLFKANTKMGIGHDSHKFKARHCEKRSDEAIPYETELHEIITLGGIKIPHSQAFNANSDGDVLTHAICNAIGTAIGQGSLSHYADAMCKKGITSSLEYLQHIKAEMIQTGYVIGNLVASIEAKEPKLEKHIPAMKEKLAEVLDITPIQIGIACTTGEELSSFGKGEGIQVFVTVQLVKI